MRFFQSEFFGKPVISNVSLTPEELRERAVEFVEAKATVERWMYPVGGYLLLGKLVYALPSPVFEEMCRAINPVSS